MGSGRRGRLARRRRFKPKKNIFGGAWAAIYLIMGLASWLVWRQGGLRAQALPLCLYMCQLGVNLFAWPPIFVGEQRRRYAVADSAGQTCILLQAVHAPCWLQSLDKKHDSSSLFTMTRDWGLFSCSSARCVSDDDGQVLHSKPGSRLPHASLLGLDLLCHNPD